MKINTALILCAGFGKRLNPLTLETPKPLLKLNNITMLEHCIKMIIKLNIKKIIINTFHLEDQIKNFLKRKDFSIKIETVSDGEKILDTGGGILNMIRSSSDNDYIIFNPDTLWHESYLKEIKNMSEFYFPKKLDNLLLLSNKDLSFDKDLSGDFNLKNNLINKDIKVFNYIGCQILNKNLFRKYKINYFSISEIWNELMIEKKLNGFESLNKFYHLTNLKTFKKLQDL